MRKEASRTTTCEAQGKSDRTTVERRTWTLALAGKRGGAKGLLIGVGLLMGLSACPSLVSPADRVRGALERLSEEGTAIDLARDRSLRIPPGSIEAMAVDAGREDRGALEAFSQLAIEGRSGDVLVSYVGNERVRVRCTTSCRVEEPFAPRLAGVIEVLWARRDALVAEDLAAIIGMASADDRNPPPTLEELRAAAAREGVAWFIRVEGRTAVVGEAAGDGSQKRLSMIREEDGWAFSAGLP